jgi:hypothetical protein
MAGVSVSSEKDFIFLTVFHERKLLQPLQQYLTIIHPGLWAIPSAFRGALSMGSNLQFLLGKIKAWGI